MDLNVDFGSPRPPQKIDSWEEKRRPTSLAGLADVVEALQAIENLARSPLMGASLRTQNFLWAMNEVGHLLIAVEELALAEPEAAFNGYPRRRGYRHPSEERKLGHPTLLGGGPARIAGELALDMADGQLRWVMNANSGRYCRETPPSKDQIDRTAEIFRRHGVAVIVDYI